MRNLVCSNHIDDDAIKEYVKSNSHIGKCDYCSDNRDRKVVSLYDLGEFMERAIRLHYGEAGNELGFNSAEGGYLGSTFDTYELLFDEIGLGVENSELQDDLSSSLPDTVWCYANPYGATESEQLGYDWEYFKNVVKHKARYSFFYIEEMKHEGFGSYSYNISDILSDIAKLITKYKLIRKLPVDTIFYRCRQHANRGEIIDAKDIAAPPDDNVVFSNRMSPAGISMFYAGFDVDTAVIETVDITIISKPYYSVGQFTSLNEIMVVDFTKLPVRPSIFNIVKQDDYHPITFLRNLVTDLSQSVKKDGREHIEYVPTQIITEYIRYILSPPHKNKVGGIIYPSAKKFKKNACVLFLNHTESMKELNFNTFIISDKSI